MPILAQRLAVVLMGLHPPAGVFRRNRECVLLMDIFGNVVARFGWECLGFCVMTNHYHLLFRTPQPNIAAGMCRLNGEFAQIYNRRHARTGHVFERRYHSELIKRDAHLLEACRYVVLNPVRAGMCERPEDHEWSSFGATIGRKESPPFLAVDTLLDLFGPRATARDRFEEFVRDRLQADTNSSRSIVKGPGPRRGSQAQRGG